jgi:hypothetical protein
MPISLLLLQTFSTAVLLDDYTEIREENWGMVLQRNKVDIRNVSSYHVANASLLAKRIAP